MHRIRSFGIRSIAAKFLASVGSPEENKCLPFEELSAKFKTASVMDACADMLMRVIQLANWRRGKNPCITGTVNVYIFTDSYLIACT